MDTHQPLKHTKLDHVENNYITVLGTGDTFDLQFSPMPTTFGNFHEESIKAAQKIYDQKQGKLHLLYSGGLDSEHALSIFLKLKMDIVPVIIKLGRYNEHDIKYAVDFCEGNGLKPVIVDIDFDHFVKSGQMLDIAKSIRSSVHHRSATAYAAGKLDGTVMLGDGEPYLKVHDNVWYIEIYEHDYAVANYFEQQGINGTTHFNRWTPEMFCSFFSDERMINLANNVYQGKESSNSSKIFVYNRHGDLYLKQRPKYTGYEEIENSEIFKHNDFRLLEESGKSYDGVFSTNYFDFMKTLRVEK